MAKKRTKKEKLKVKHQFSVAWSSGGVKFDPEASVNRQIGKSDLPGSEKSKKINDPQKSAKETDLKLNKKSIYKSIIISLMILGSEVVLYFALKRF